MADGTSAPHAAEARPLRGHAHYPTGDDAGPLVTAAAAVVTGTVEVHELVAVLRRSTVYCEAPDRPEVMTAATPSGPSSRSAPRWRSRPRRADRSPGSPPPATTCPPQLPAGHDVLLDPAGPDPVLLRAALWAEPDPQP